MIIAAISMMSVTTLTLATFVWGLRKEEAQLCIVGGLLTMHTSFGVHGYRSSENH